MTNETYRIRATSPLLRPGLTIEAEVSKRYLVPVVCNLLDLIRDINNRQKPSLSSDKGEG